MRVLTFLSSLMCERYEVVGMCSLYWIRSYNIINARGSTNYKVISFLRGAEILLVLLSLIDYLLFIYLYIYLD